MKNITFKKMHGAGNDFVLIDSKVNPDIYTDGKLNLTQSQLQRIASRNYGIGCDQILLIEPNTNTQAHFDYRVYNQDGGAARYCGNGARCVIRYLSDTYKIAYPIILNTNGYITYGEPIKDDQITISIKAPSFNAQESGYTGKIDLDNNYQCEIDRDIINFSIVFIGNAHIVIRVRDQTLLHNTSKLSYIGKTLTQYKLFNHGVNINFFYPTEKNIINLRTYENGCGLTLACGSGACATAAYAILNNIVDNQVDVEMPGGKLQIFWDKVGNLQMIGEAIYVFAGTMLI